MTGSGCVEVNPADQNIERNTRLPVNADERKTCGHRLPSARLVGALVSRQPTGGDTVGRD